MGLASALLAACSPKPPPKQAALKLESCTIKQVDTAARCGLLQVPQDHAQPDSGKMVSIHVAVLPAMARHAEPDPLYLLAGGPGQAASDLGALVSVLHTVRRSRDIVLVDQRGTGQSKTLTCDLRPSLDSSGDAGRKVDVVTQILTENDAQSLQDWAHCIATIEGNPKTARTDDYVDDLESVRKALGQRQINLWGGSYGTRVALRYMKRYPGSIRSAVLDSVAPTAWRLPDDALTSSEAELRQTLAACSVSPACAQNLPDALAQFDQLLSTLHAQPRRVSLRHPATGQTVEGTISRRSVIMLLWQLLYRPDTERLIPQLVKQANAGDFAPLLSLAASGPQVENIAMVQRFAVMCAEDMLGRTPPVNPRFQSITDMFYSFCQDFPHGTVEPEFYEPTRSHIPTLLLSGALDPVTPPAQAALAAQTLSRSKHYTVGGMGHIVTPQACVRSIVTRFVEEGDIPATDAACTERMDLPRPLFYISALEAQP